MENSIVVCDTSNNSKEDIEQGKLNVSFEYSDYSSTIVFSDTFKYIQKSISAFLGPYNYGPIRGRLEDIHHMITFDDSEAKRLEYKTLNTMRFSQN
jgi:hypothetical protein